MFIWSFFTAKLGLTVHNFDYSVPKRGSDIQVEKSENVKFGHFEKATKV